MTMLSIIAAAAAAAAQSDAPDLGWLSGYWLSCDGGREVSETWTGPRGGLLLGNGVTTSANGIVSYEAMRIGPSAAGVSFFAQPSGQPAAEFPLKSSANQQLIFENPAHDFPQRVIYRREGNRLIGRIEGMLNGKLDARDWSYEAAELNARCPNSSP